VLKELRRVYPARQPEAWPIRKRAVGDQRDAPVEIPDGLFVVRFFVLDLRADDRLSGREQQKNCEGAKGRSPAKHRGFQHKRVYPLGGSGEKESVIVNGAALLARTVDLAGG